MSKLNEAEIQLLASLRGAEIEAAPTDRAALEKCGERYLTFLEDWSAAWSSLIAKGLIEGDDSGYRLGDAGRPLAEACHADRPDSYWYYYQKFYPAAFASAAHSRLCERVFGKDLCQEGQVDMDGIRDLLTRLDLQAGDRVLDIGCGAGVIAEYISAQTGANVTGLDYAASAIALANERTAGKRSQLNFVEGDINALDFPAQSFDAVVSLDTLYWVADLTGALSQLARIIKPGGRIGIFMSQDRHEGAPADILEADKTSLARALSSQNLAYDASDYTANNARFWRRIQEAVTELRDDFEAEGNGFIAASLLREAEEEFLPAFEAGTLTRYLYHVRL